LAVPGYFPGIPGFAAFAGIKFSGYVLAGLALKKLQPAISASAVKIAGARTGLGILLGPPLVLGALYGLTQIIKDPRSSGADYIFYPFLFLVRIVVWALVIYLFTRSVSLAKSRLWKYAVLGALWSCLLDVPGVALALVSPGHIPIC
jgi:hypothetical protein